MADNSDACDAMRRQSGWSYTESDWGMLFRSGAMAMMIPTYGVISAEFGIQSTSGSFNACVEWLRAHRDAVKNTSLPGDKKP